MMGKKIKKRGKYLCSLNGGAVAFESLRATVTVYYYHLPRVLDICGATAGAAAFDKNNVMCILPAAQVAFFFFFCDTTVYYYTFHCVSAGKMHIIIIIIIITGIINTRIDENKRRRK